MGAQFSKKAGDNTTPQLPPQINTPDLNSYENACRLDPTLQSFDVTLQERTNLVINTLAVGMEVRSLSLDSLRSVTTCLLDMNQEVVKVILDSKKDIWNTPELFHLVEDYFENSLQTLDFCTALEKCLKQARDTQLMVQISIQQFEKDAEESSYSQLKYSKTLEELKNFKSAGSPFSEEFFSLFLSVNTQQVSMLHKLQIRKRKLDRKLRALKVWRRVSNVIFVTALVAVLICSVAAAAISAPPVVTAVAAASAVPFGSMGRWFDSMWKGFEDAVKGQGEIVRSMQVSTAITIKDLDGIGVLVKRFEREMESLLENGDLVALGGEDEEAMKNGVVEIKDKIAVFMETVDDLVSHAEKCSQDITKARTVVLQRIIRHPSED